MRWPLNSVVRVVSSVQSSSSRGVVGWNAVLRPDVLTAWSTCSEQVPPTPPLLHLPVFPFSLLLPFIPPAMVSVRRQVLGTTSSQQAEVGGGWQSWDWRRESQQLVGEEGRGGERRKANCFYMTGGDVTGADTVRQLLLVISSYPTRGWRSYSSATQSSADPTRSLLPRGNRKN